MRQNRTVNSGEKKKKTTKVRPAIVPAYCMEKVSSHCTRKGYPDRAQQNPQIAGMQIRNQGGQES